jgi:chloramphenicol 3-O-phosphotransferase
MPNMTFRVSEELRREIRRHKDIVWAEIVRRALAREVHRPHIYDRLLATSQLTESDAVQLGRSIRRRGRRAKS